MQVVILCIVQVLEFMEGGDLRQALSSPDAHKYHWDNLGQHVAMDVVRGLHFLHRNKVQQASLPQFESLTLKAICLPPERNKTRRNSGASWVELEQSCVAAL